jgi:hypothetical protein
VNVEHGASTIGAGCGGDPRISRLFDIPTVESGIQGNMATLNDKLILLKGNLEPSETLSLMIQARHNAVRRSVKKGNPNVVDTKLIGSVRRKTRIHPRTEDKFDIDILVIFGSFYS